MHRIRASGWHLLGLIDAVLFYAGGKPVLEHHASTRTDVTGAIGEVMGMFESYADDKSLTMTLNAPAEPMVINVDDRSLRQIMVNLISNAVKFTEHASTVGAGATFTIELPRVDALQSRTAELNGARGSRPDRRQWRAGRAGDGHQHAGNDWHS